MTNSSVDQVEILQADLDNPTHCQAVVDLLNDYANHAMGRGSPLSADIHDALIPGLRAHPTSLILLARVEQRFVGIATCFIGFSTFNAKPLINIHDLSVSSGFRGLGLGKKLLTTVADKARGLGCCKVTLEVREDNARARRLYTSEGFGFPGSAKEEEEVRYLYQEKRL
jgi:ribosomal protein S18 acetylase RimI-like enzyme